MSCHQQGDPGLRDSEKWTRSARVFCGLFKAVIDDHEVQGTHSDGPEATKREDGHSIQFSVACVLFDVGQEDTSVQVTVGLAVIQYLLCTQLSQNAFVRSTDTVPHKCGGLVTSTCQIQCRSVARLFDHV